MGAVYTWQSNSDERESQPSLTEWEIQEFLQTTGLQGTWYLVRDNNDELKRAINASNTSYVTDIAAC